MKSDHAWIRRGQRALRMLSELHRMGYQQLRGMPYLHPLSWRLAVAPKAEFSPRNGAVIPPHTLGEPGKVVITGPGDYFGWTDAANDDARALAEKFAERFPELCARGRGRDWAYAGWLAELLGVLEQGDWLPAVSWEHMTGTPDDLRTLPIWVLGRENLVWNADGSQCWIDPVNPGFDLPPP